MIDAQIIIIGGGPAGSSCAWKLQNAGKDVLLLDKKEFPRLKLCAGWITPQVIKDLDINIETYPHSLVTFKRLNCYFRGFKIPLKTLQYSIRRIEFDHWLLQRSNVRVFNHSARKIVYKNGRYIIDDKFRSQYLVGAGGTYCPVYNTFFKEINPRAAEQNIVALEQEFPFNFTDPHCHLWFFDHKLSGYSWYVPKGKGFLNIGIGGKVTSLKVRAESIRDHWLHFVQKLDRLGLIKEYQFNPQGYQYFLRQDVDTVHYDNAFIIGDAAGLATKDMGEGIGPAVAGGLLAAEAIMHNKNYSVQKISKYSLPGILFPNR